VYQEKAAGKMPAVPGGTPSLYMKMDHYDLSRDDAD
jgi:hypothetical protein